MSGELEAAGGMASAGLIAASVDGPDPGKGGGEGECLNCGAPLSGGRFCSNCGQPAHANRSLVALLEELLWNVFNLDTKAWRTLPRLIFRPGTLTRSYIDGKRARYLTPLATFLLCYFFMFLVFSVVQTGAPIRLSDGDSAGQVSDTRENLNDARENLQEAQQGLTEARQEAGPHPNAAQQVGIATAERAIRLAQAEVQRRQAALERAQAHQHATQQSPVRVHLDDADVAAIRQAKGAQSPAAPPAPVAPTTTTATTTTTTTAATPATNPPQPPAVNGPTITDDNGPITLDDVLKKIASENVTIDGRGWLSPSARAQLANPPLFYNHLQDAASRWGFLLVPLSLPFIAFLFFFKKNITLYDHTVFALNSLSFASLLFALIMGSSKVEALHFVEGAAVLFAPPIHTFFHVGGAYKLKWWSALWRTFFLLFFSTIVLCVFFVAVLFIGLSG